MFLIPCIAWFVVGSLVLLMFYTLPFCDCLCVSFCPATFCFFVDVIDFLCCFCYVMLCLFAADGLFFVSILLCVLCVRSSLFVLCCLVCLRFDVFDCLLVLMCVTLLVPGLFVFAMFIC